MNKTKNQYNPDWVACPGATLQELLDWHNISVKDLAEQMQVSVNEVNEILNGSYVITHEIAVQFSEMFGQSVEFWINLENNYRSKLKELESKK